METIKRVYETLGHQHLDTAPAAGWLALGILVGIAATVAATYVRGERSTS